MTTEPPLGVGEEFATTSEVKAFAVWRTRFENLRDIIPGERAPKTELRLEVSRWPVEAEVTDATWLMFCALCFLADLDSVNTWTMGILRMEPKGPENPHWIALLNEIRPQIVPKLFPLPPHLTYAFTRPEHAHRGRLWISICSDSFACPDPDFCTKFISSTSMAVTRLAASQLAALDEADQTQGAICMTPTGSAISIAEPARLYELNPSATLDGSSGTYRMPMAPLIAVNNDLQAIRVWLRSYDANPQTQRAFTNAIEKLVNWAYVARGKPVSSLDKTDFFAFEAFLSNPQPTALWIRHPNQHAWRPFRQPQSPQSIRFVMDVVRTLFVWLHRVQYASVSRELQTFMTERPRASSAQTASEFERGHDSETMKPDEIEYLWRAVERNPEQCPMEHALIAKLSFYGMLSIPEIQQLRCSDVGIHKGAILLFVRRRRPGRQSVYAVPPLAAALLEWLRYSNMRPAKIEKFDLFSQKPGAALLGLSQATVRVKLRHALNVAARVAESEGDAQSAKRLPKIGTRSLKRTFAAQLTAVGADKWGLFGDVTDISNSLLKRVPERGFLSEAMVADRLASLSHLWPEEQTYSLDDLLTEFTERRTSANAPSAV
ncbi:MULTISPECIES: site-specific integrase [Pandoraea]|nr:MULTISPECIES: site-specific integrase [Pandoraea]UVA81899.1 site-specific integrase [Pandoraea commovens]